MENFKDRYLKVFGDNIAELEAVEKGIQVQEKGNLQEANKLFQNVKYQNISKEKLQILNEMINRNLQILRKDLKNKQEIFNKNQYKHISQYSPQRCQKETGNTEQTENQQIDEQNALIYSLNSKGIVLELQVFRGKDEENSKKIVHFFFKKNGEQKEKQKIFIKKEEIANKLLIMLNDKDYNNNEKDINLEKLMKENEYFEAKMGEFLQFNMDYQEFFDKKGENDTQKNQNQPLDEDATMEFETENLFPQENNIEKIEGLKDDWKVQNYYKMDVYKKNENMLINHCIHRGGQGQVYQSLDLKSSKLYVFKQMTDRKDYELEKSMLEKLEKDEEIMKKIVFLENFQSDDEYQILILPQCECSLLDYMEIKYSEFNKDENNKNAFHLNKGEFISLLEFQVKAMINFERIGIYLQDNKPQNLLMKKKLAGSEFQFQPKYTDFGAVFSKKIEENQENKEKQQDKEIEGYPNFKTDFYFDNGLYLEKQGYIYKKKDVVRNEIYTIARSLQKCLFPCCSENRNLIIDRDNMGQFLEEIEKQYDEQLKILFKQMVDDQFENRFYSFQQLFEAVQAYKDQNQIKFKEFWPDFDNKVRLFNTRMIHKFYREYYMNLAQNIDITVMKQIQIGMYLIEEGMFEESLVIFKLIQKEKWSVMSEFEQCLVLYHLRNIYEKFGERELCVQLALQELKIKEELYGENHEETAHSLNSLAISYKQIGEFEKAKEIYLKAISVYDKNFGQDNSHNGKCYVNLGNLVLDQGKFEEGIEFLRKGLKIKVRFHGEGSIETANCITQMGTGYYQMRKFEEALEYYQKGFEIKQKKYGEMHIQVADSLSNISNCLLQQGKFQEALGLQEKSLEIKGNCFGDGHISLANGLNSLGNIQLSLGNFEEGRKLYERSLGIYEGYYGKDHVQCAGSINNIGYMCLQGGDFERARGYAEKAYEIKCRHYGEDSGQNLSSLQILVCVYEKLEDKEKMEIFKDKFENLYSKLNQYQA